MAVRVSRRGGVFPGIESNQFLDRMGRLGPPHMRTWVAVDVHARSVVACGLHRGTGEVVEQRLTPGHREIRLDRRVAGWFCHWQCSGDSPPTVVQVRPGLGVGSRHGGARGTTMSNHVALQLITLDFRKQSPSESQVPSSGNQPADIRLDPRRLAPLLPAHLMTN